eukprot:s6397_g3.t1
MQKLAKHQNALGQYSSLGTEVFFTEFGADWTSYRSARNRRRVDFSGPQWSLETLEGEQENGLMHKQFIREHIEVLNLAKNKLTDIGCLNAMKDTRAFEFRRLQILNASRNMLTFVKLVNPSLTEINLSHNELIKLPDFSSLTQLSKLLLSHNYIDDMLDQFGQLQKLRVLDLSSNRFFWRPTLFKKQLGHLERIHLEELRFWPNPFAEGFKEYQFITASTLTSLTSLDGFQIDSDLRFQLRVQADQLQLNIADFSIFDVRVEERRKRNAPVEALPGREQEVAGVVPLLTELIEAMRKSLDQPNDLLKHVYDLEQKVSCMWNAHFWDRRRLMLAEDGERKQRSYMKPAEADRAAAEFADKMQQVLGRFESVQDVLVMCLVRMLGCGNRQLSERCGTLLAEWVDANAEELHDRMDNMSEALFNDLRHALVVGIKSVNEKPMACYEASHGAREPEDDSELEQTEASWHILAALRRFGPSRLYDKVVSPWRARVLRPFLPALCRETKEVLGPDQPPDRWSKYQGFDSFSEDVAEVLEVQEKNLVSCEEKCVRQGFGGFVVEATDELGMVKVCFKQQSPQTLASLRRSSSKRTLHVRPLGRPPKRPNKAAEEGGGRNHSWEAWVDGLAVLVTATSDSQNAAYCVSYFDAHLAVTKHESDKQGFTEAALLGSSEANNAFVRLLQLARNLMQAYGDAGLKAARHFLEAKLHTNCWARARRRLQEGGSPLPISRLSEMNPDDVALISELVGILHTMVKCGDLEISNQAMNDILAENGMDVFEMLLEVAASSANPDPLFLAISYESVYVFVQSDIMRPRVLSKVISRLRETAILLPYIRGPYIKDVPNEKYMQLWCKCELKYGMKNDARERLEKRYTSLDPDEHSQWRELVPEIRELQNTMMHRTLLGIVKIIQLFSDLARRDDSPPSLKMVTDLLNANDRERLLIGPTTGLVTCPDFDVRVESLICIRHVLEATPDQFDLEEMGWLLNYLTSVGMGIGKQGQFLTEVIDLIKMFVRNNSRTGQSFRNKFAKYAIRECFEMLTVNSRRETHGNKEEAKAKADLTAKIIELLKDCSRPLSGGLRKFLRRVDLLQSIREVLQQEERTSSNPATQILDIWTGRDIRQVLLPIVTSPAFDVHGPVVHAALMRLADVLQGKPDYMHSNILKDVPPTDEAGPWPGLTMLYRLLDYRDAIENEDSGYQQEYFMNSRGLDPLLDFAHRFFTANEDLNILLNRVQDKLAQELGEKERSLRAKWEGRQQDVHQSEASVKTKQEEQTMSEVVQDCLTARLRSLNEGAAAHFRCNLNQYDQKKQEFSLSKLAKVYQNYWKDNENRANQEVQERGDAVYELLRIPDKIAIDGQLRDVQDLGRVPRKQRRIRQPHRDFEKLMYQALNAHKIMKQMLCDSSKRDHNEVARWCQYEPDANGPPSVLAIGLLDFLQDNQALAIDAGLRPREELLVQDKYKYFRRHDRRTNLSCIVLEFPDARCLLAALQEFLKRAQRLFLYQVRNRFRLASDLGEYCIALKFQLQLKDSSIHYSELRMCLSGKSKKNNTVQQYRDTMKKVEEILHSSCDVPTSETTLVAQYLSTMLRSRSIHHSDIIFLRCKDVNLEVDGEEVFAQSAELTSCQLFVIEREAGDGVVKTGDRIRLKSKFTQKFLDVHASGHLRCRLPDFSEDYDMTFTVEAIGCRDDYALSRCGMKGSLTEFRSVHTETSLRLKVSATNFVTVRQGANFLTSFGEKLSVKSEPNDAAHEAGQVFTIFRDGALLLDFHSTHSGSRAAIRTLALETSDEILQKTMMEAHMRTEISNGDVDVQGSSFRTVPPEFKTMMWSIAGHFRHVGHSKHAASHEASSLHKLWTRASKNLAAILRCLFVMMEFPQCVGGRRYVLDTFATRMTQHSSLPRIIALVSAVQLVRKEKMPDGELDLTCALLPKKFMRFCSALLSNLWVCQKPDEIEAIFTVPREQERHERELATIDRERMHLLSMVGSYTCDMVVKPMLDKLRVAGQRPLSRDEVLVFQDFASLCMALVQSIFDNEMRCLSLSNQASHHHHHHGATAISDKERAGPQSGQSPSHKDAVAIPQNVDDGEQGDALNTNVLLASNADKFRANTLSQDARAAVVAEIIPPITIKALVHLFLYALHQEAIAFRSATRDTEIPVRVISGIINQCVTALAALMTLTGKSNAEVGLTEDAPDASGSCDYDVCEAISQAMTEGAQLVPRARVAQLQAERGADCLRAHVQKMMEEGSFEFSSHRGPKLNLSTERVSTVGFVWTRLAGDIQDTRCLLVTTTRFRMILLRVPARASAMPQPADLHVLSEPRNMQDLKRVIFDLRMRQILCLVWDGEEGLKFQRLVFESSGRRRSFQEVLRKVPRKQQDSGEEDGKKETASIRMRARGILESAVKSTSLESLRETCQVRRGGIPLVSVTFVQSTGGLGLNAQLDMLVLTRCSVTVVSFNSFWSKFWRSDDESHYEREVTQASLDTDSEDDRLPDFSESVVATSNDHADKCEALHGPWDLEDLQGVWFLSEASPKVRLQFGSTLEVTFLSDGERQRFRRHLATILAEGAVPRAGKASQAWAVVPTDKTDIKTIQKETGAVQNARLALTRGEGT